MNQSVIQLFPPKAVFLLVHAFFFYFRVLHYINFGAWVFTSRGPYSLRPLGRLVTAGPGTSSWLFGPGVAALGHKAGGRGASYHWALLDSSRRTARGSWGPSNIVCGFGTICAARAAGGAGCSLSWRVAALVPRPRGRGGCFSRGSAWHFFHTG